MIFPVTGFRNGMTEQVAEFFDLSAAETFAMHPERDGFYDRNLYIAEPRRDRRARGYRFQASGWERAEQCAVQSRKAA